MGRTINRVNLAAIIIAIAALVVGLGYIISQPISAQGNQSGIEQRLQQAVESGKITQAAANERLKVASRMSRERSEDNLDDNPKVTTADLRTRLQAAVDAGKLTQTEADDKLEAFSSGAMKRGKEVGKPKMTIADLEAKLQAAVDAGKLTQTEADEKLEAFSNNGEKHCDKVQRSKLSGQKDVDARIQRGVENGFLRQDQADAMKLKVFQDSKKQAA